VTRRRGRRHKQALEGISEERRYWKMKEEPQIALCSELAWEDDMDLP